MSVLIYIDSENGNIKKNTFEVASYAKSLAMEMNTQLVAVGVNIANVEILGSYGVDKILAVADEKLQSFSAPAVSHLIGEAVRQESSTVIVFSSSWQAKQIAPLLAYQLQAGYVSNVISLPESDFTVKCSAFSNKAVVLNRITTPIKIIALAPNAFAVEERPTNATVEVFSPTFSSTDFKVAVIGTEKASGKVSLDDASIVVSGGRGLKGGENWQIIEELAEVLGAATACSKPVADMGWRPHAEHVGQTGKAIAPNLYIAIGISGAIQHLAGVNASKVKLVINSDAEAPFFKAADYGIVGDAFEVVPKLIGKLKERQ